MTVYNAGLIIGSIASASINRRLASALVKLAPQADLNLTEIPIAPLPFYSYDNDGSIPAEAAEFKAAIEAAYREGEAKLKGSGKTVPALSSLKTPLRDGDLERPDDDAYAGSYFINANSATAPGIVDKACEPILDRSEIYSGVHARASINFYSFNSNGNRGIACGLNNIQKLRDGDPLGGKSRAEDDFATDDDDDFLS